MDIRKKIKFIIVVLVLFSAVFGALIYFSFGKYKLSLEQATVGDKMVASSLNGRLIASDYLLYPSDRATEQWNAEQDSLKKLTNADINPDTPEEKELIDKIQDDLISVGSIFEQLVSVNADSSKVALRQEKEGQLVEELTLKTQEISRFSAELADLNDKEAATFSNYIFILFFSLSFLFLAVLAVSFWIIWKSVNQLEDLRRQTQEEKERLNTLMQSIGDGVIAIDRSWNITIWNNAAAALTGYAKEETLGRPFRDIVKFIREDNRKENITFIEETMLFGKIHFMENHTLLVRKDGREIPVGDSAAPVFDQDGKVTGAIIVFRDVSKEYKLEESRKEFASLATHQLRTPVGIIKGYMELLFQGNQGPLTAEQKDSLMKIQQTTERLHLLVNAMLNISKIESGSLAIAPEPAYLPDLADEVAQEMLPQIQEKKLQLEKQYAKDIPSVNVDPKLTGAIFRNLLSNAIKYTPDGGKIAIKIERKEQNILIAISDTGFGIPKEQQSKMFTKFFRGDNVQTKQIEGTGLGLYVVRSILEQSGGNISFMSPASTREATAGKEENPGTTFFVTIPISGMQKKEGTKGLT